MDRLSLTVLTEQRMWFFAVVNARTKLLFYVKSKNVRTFSH